MTPELAVMLLWLVVLSMSIVALYKKVEYLEALIKIILDVLNIKKEKK